MPRPAARWRCLAASRRCPALPALSVGTERVSMNITYIPKVDPKAVPLWFFQLKINLSGFR